MRWNVIFARIERTMPGAGSRSSPLTIVVWTSGGIEKLDVYRKLRVREVWYWQKGQIPPYILRGERFEAAAGSEVLPGIELALLASFIDRPTSAAMREYRAALEA